MFLDKTGALRLHRLFSQPGQHLRFRLFSSLADRMTTFGPTFKHPVRNGDFYLERSNAHPRDLEITFDEEKHKYFYQGNVLSNSVTQIISSYFERFDPDSSVKKMMEGPNWPRPQYMLPDGNPLTAKEILKQWDENSECARNEGSSTLYIASLTVEDKIFSSYYLFILS
jgi:hypothetical protein